MEQQSFIEGKGAGCKNPWVVSRIDYSQLEDGIETIILKNTQDQSEHIATISNREDASNINIVFSLDGRDIGPLSEANNVVNAIIKYRGTIGISLDNNGLLTSLDLKAFLYVKMWNPSYQGKSLLSIGYGNPENALIPEKSDDKDFLSFLMDNSEHISTLIIGPNENEYYLFDTSDNIHQNTDQTQDGSVQANNNIYSPEIVDSIICLNKIPMPDDYGSTEKSCKIQGENCCMDWTMMFNAVIHEHKNIDNVIIGRNIGQPLLNPEILKETARRVVSINESFIGPDYNEFLQYLQQSLQRIQEQRANISPRMQRLNRNRRTNREIK